MKFRSPIIVRGIVKDALFLSGGMLTPMGWKNKYSLDCGLFEYSHYLWVEVIPL